MKKFFLAAGMAILSVSVFAKSFSLQIVQKNTPQEKVYNASYLIEQTVLDYFFERGCIVSSNSILISKNQLETKSSIRQSFIESKNGCMDYLINMEIFYDARKSNNPNGILLSNIAEIQWQIISLSTSETLSSGKTVVGSIKNDDDNSLGVESLAKTVAKNIQNELGKQGW